MQIEVVIASIGGGARRDDGGFVEHASEETGSELDYGL